MGILKSFITNVVVRFFSWYFKVFRYAGGLLLILLIECICLCVWCDNELGMENVRSEEVQIENVVIEEGMDGEQNSGYHFYMTFKNIGSRDALANGNYIYDEDGYSISCTDPGIYKNIKGWGFSYTGVIVPPGSEAVTDVFVKKETLELEDTEYLIVKAEDKGKEWKIPIEEILSK